MRFPQSDFRLESDVTAAFVAQISVLVPGARITGREVALGRGRCDLTIKLAGVPGFAPVEVKRAAQWADGFQIREYVLAERAHFGFLVSGADFPESLLEAAREEPWLKLVRVHPVSMPS